MLVLAAMFFEIDPRIIMQGAEIIGGGAQPTQTETQHIIESQQEASEFTSVVLADTEDTSNVLFSKQLNSRYQAPTLVLFNGAWK